VDTSNSKNERMGKHAVVIAGYSLGNGHLSPYQNGFLLRAARIDKIYAHDDQVGPFARMEFDGKKVSLKGKTVESLSTTWPGEDGKKQSVRAVQDLIMIPLYHKIRIPFQIIHDVVFGFDLFIEQIRNNVPQVFPQRYEWDIYLTTGGEFKNDILNIPGIDSNLKIEILSQSMPRFIWRATALVGTDRMLDLVFDATDVEQGQIFIRAVEYNKNQMDVLRVVAKNAPFDDEARLRPWWKIIEWFKS
jgi:hypothetical protein